MFPKCSKYSPEELLLNSNSRIACFENQPLICVVCHTVNAANPTVHVLAFSGALLDISKHIPGEKYEKSRLPT